MSLELLADRLAVEPGGTVELAIRVKMDPTWHTYWLNGGDAGQPFVAKWTLPADVTVEPLRFPVPERYVLDGGFGNSDLVSYVYHDEAILRTTVHVPPTARPGTTLDLAGMIRWVMCAKVCVPGKVDLQLSLPVVAVGQGTTASAGNRANFDVFDTAAAHQPARDVGWAVTFETTATELVLHLKPEAGAAVKTLPATLAYIPSRHRLIDDSATQVLTTDADGNGVTLTVPLSPEVDLTGEPLTAVNGLFVADRPWAVPVGAAITPGTLAWEVLPPVAVAPASTSGDANSPSGIASSTVNSTVAAITPARSVGPELGLISALVFLFLGGLILNLMPCVLPVLSIKVLSLVKQAQDEKTSPMIHALAYTVGVIGSFEVMVTILHVVATRNNTTIVWATQMQNTNFVVMLAAVMFLLGLSLFGVFEIGTGLVGVGQGTTRRTGLGGSFMTGLLAVLVATPCVGPFMGLPLAWALGQPLGVKWVAFFVLGFGMALPYLLLAVFPKLLKYVPKPGEWMDSMKQFFGFLMVGTVVWFLWFLASSVDRHGMVRVVYGLLAVALGAWVLGRWSTPYGTRRARWIARSLFAVLVAGGVSFGLWAATSYRVLKIVDDSDRLREVRVAHDLTWYAWNPRVVASQRAQGKYVFVDFTADWCLSCKFNEGRAFRSEMTRNFKELEVIPLIADWTDGDETITQALSEFQRSGVPLYVFYSPDTSVPPILLEGMISESDVVQALEQIHAATAGKTRESR